jgi:predicted nucleotidyltransferase
VSALPASFAELLRQGRETNARTLREVAECLKVDVSLVSKWERGERKPTREEVVKLAKYLKADANAWLVAWLRDAVVYAVGHDELALQAVQAAEAQVAYNELGKATIDRTIKRLKELLKEQPVIRRAWLFGSFARKEARLGSDIDLMVEYDPKLKVSYFDQFGIAEVLAQALGRKVDIVEMGMLKDFAARTAEKDMILIHG